MPKVSVLMTNYNGSAYIAEAIESILAQTYTDFDFIIIDDGSTDKSWSIIQKYQEKDTRIRSYQNDSNLGISRTRNKLIDLAQGTYIAWLDSDDCAYPDRLRKQVEFLDTHKEYGIVGSWMVFINSQGVEKGIKELPITDAAIRKQWYFRNSLNHPTLMMRRECIEKTGYYNSDFDGAEDYDFGVRAGTLYPLANIPEVLVKYRIHTSNASLQKRNKIIQKTLLIRKKMKTLGYPYGIQAQCAYWITWCMQYLPPKMTLSLFFRFIKIFSSKKMYK